MSFKDILDDDRGGVGSSSVDVVENFFHSVDNGIRLAGLFLCMVLLLWPLTMLAIYELYVEVVFLSEWATISFTLIFLASILCPVGVIIKSRHWPLRAASVVGLLIFAWRVYDQWNFFM